MKRILNSLSSLKLKPLPELDLKRLQQIKRRQVEGDLTAEYSPFSRTMILKSTTAPIYRGADTRYANTREIRNQMAGQIYPSSQGSPSAFAIGEFLVQYHVLAPRMIKALESVRWEHDYEPVWKLKAIIPKKAWESKGVQPNETAKITSPDSDEYRDPMTLQPSTMIKVEHANYEQCDVAYEFIINAVTDGRYLVEQTVPLIQAEIEVEGSSHPCLVDRRDYEDVNPYGPFKVCESTEDIRTVAGKAFVADFILPTEGGQRVGYRNGDRFDCRRRNLFVIEDRFPAESLNLTSETAGSIQHQATLRGMSPEEFLCQLM